jgi:hypothetical protein
MPNRGQRLRFSTDTSGERISASALPMGFGTPRWPHPELHRRQGSSEGIRVDGSVSPNSWPRTGRVAGVPFTTKPSNAFSGVDRSAEVIGTVIMFGGKRPAVSSEHERHAARARHPALPPLSSDSMSLDWAHRHRLSRSAAASGARSGARASSDTKSTSMPLPVTSYKSIPPSAMYLISR